MKNDASFFWKKRLMFSPLAVMIFSISAVVQLPRRISSQTGMSENKMPDFTKKANSPRSRSHRRRAFSSSAA